MSAESFARASGERVRFFLRVDFVFAAVGVGEAFLLFDLLLRFFAGRFADVCLRFNFVSFFVSLAILCSNRRIFLSRLLTFIGVRRSRKRPSLDPPISPCHVQHVDLARNN